MANRRMSNPKLPELLEQLSGVVPAMERIAAALESMAADHGNKSTSAKPTASRQSQAMVWSLTTGCTDLTQIAEEFGVSRRTVERWSDLRSLIDNLAHVDAGGPVAGFFTDNGVEGIERG